MALHCQPAITRGLKPCSEGSFEVRTKESFYFGTVFVGALRWLRVSVHMRWGEKHLRQQTHNKKILRYQSRAVVSMAAARKWTGLTASRYNKLRRRCHRIQMTSQIENINEIAVPLAGYTSASLTGLDPFAFSARKINL
ncbi:hypothetical protein EVAR_75524_1 [Eumeta japonica]|uniref:Uncharacterized protein n=1 Tax=Eumeta variegata TaxID=151549 RepID=A0A4C1UK95_EUMVA|nr:hypothetical protein EVAR_75524_1 [Eumeta japonica]